MTEFNCGWIEIKRSSQYVNRIRAIDIFVDGAKAGSVMNGESKVFETPPGQHQVLAKIDWCKTPPLNVNILPGETTSLLCGSELAGWQLILTVLYLFIPSKWIYLKRSTDNPGP